MALRCKDGFLMGLCRVPSCPHYEGDREKTSSVTRACGICGKPTTRKNCTVCSATRTVEVRYQRRRLARNHA